MSLYNQNANLSLPYTLSSAAVQEADVREDMGITQQRMTRNFGQRALPDLMNRYAARGTFLSGGARVAGDRLREDYLEDYGDVGRLGNRKLADIARNRVLAAMGLVI